MYNCNINNNVIIGIIYSKQKFYDKKKKTNVVNHVRDNENKGK